MLCSYILTNIIFLILMIYFAVNVSNDTVNINDIISD